MTNFVLAILLVVGTAMPAWGLGLREEPGPLELRLGAMLDDLVAPGSVEGSARRLEGFTARLLATADRLREPSAYLDAGSRYLAPVVALIAAKLQHGGQRPPEGPAPARLSDAPVFIRRDLASLAVTRLGTALIEVDQGVPQRDRQIARHLVGLPDARLLLSEYRRLQRTRRGLVVPQAQAGVAVVAAAADLLAIFAAAEKLPKMVPAEQLAWRATATARITEQREGAWRDLTKGLTNLWAVSANGRQASEHWAAQCRAWGERSRLPEHVAEAMQTVAAVMRRAVFVGQGLGAAAARDGERPPRAWASYRERCAVRGAPLLH